MTVPIRIDQLVAALALDSAQALAVSERYAIIMRDPQPDEGGIPVDWPIYLRVVDLSGDPADPSSIGFRVYVNTGAGEVEAFDDVNIRSPWNGAQSAYAESTGADFYCWREVRLDQAPTVYSSEQTVAVRVALRVGSGGWGHFEWGREDWGHAPATPTFADVSYSFQVADVTPPSLVSAVAVGPRTVRVTFNDAMATGPGMVDDPAVWTIDRENVDPSPGVSLECVAVDEVDGSDGTQWDLSTQWAMTPGCPYRVRVAHTATDLAGNQITGHVPD